ncbi:MAG: ParA family protein [Acidobacteria bacterium]|nr:ParA family protein [Acidobacteriota bacterium]
MSPRVVIFSNQKGGVGKTTLTREIGLCLADEGRRVLLVDCDPQGNLTKSLVDGADGGLYEALTGTEVRITEIDEHLALLAGDFRLSLLEKSLIGEIDAYSRLRDLLGDPRLGSFDLVLLDTPPSLGVLTVNALAASSDLVIPMNPSLYSMQGTNDLLRTVSKVRATLNPVLALLGVIVNAYDSVPVITRQIRAEIAASFGDKVFGTVLSKSIRIEEAIAARRGVIHHAASHRTAEEVHALAGELVTRLAGPGGES